jgi:hypothetical protein
MIARILKYIPLAVASLILVAMVLGIVRTSVRQNDGNFVYPLDDSYIHMAMAKNLVQHGTWGVTPVEFTSSSSSPFWTLLLALGYLLLGIHDWIPLMFATFSGLGLLVVSDRFLKENRVGHFRRAVILILIVVIGALPSLLFSGLEHAFHALLTLLFLLAVGQWLESKAEARAQVIRIALLAALLCATRYEGAFVLALAVFFGFLRRRFTSSVILLCSGLLPIVGYALVSLAHGWYWLPNSVLLKGAMPSFQSLATLLQAIGGRALTEAASQPHVALLLVGGVAGAMHRFSRNESVWDMRAIVFLLFSGALLLHLQFAHLGRFYRYEGYLVVIGILLTSAELSDAVPGDILKQKQILTKLLLPLALGLVFYFPFLVRGTAAFRDAPRASGNIYEQQFQMARFLRANYSGQPVVANDVGAINYFADIRVVDIWGLGSLETARLRVAANHSPDALQRVIIEKKAAVALVYDSWMFEYFAVPKAWTFIGDWELQDNVVCASSVVSFYATLPSEVPRLRSAFREFSPLLPQKVGVREPSGWVK